MTSSKLGAERRAFLKNSIDNFPFPPLNSYSKRYRNKAIKLSRKLETDPQKPWNQINDFIFDLYGYSSYDQQVVKDTLEVADPFKAAKDRANAQPLKAERNSFYTELRKLLNPAFKITRETVSIDEVDISWQNKQSPWHFFSISSLKGQATLSKTLQKRLILKITKEANKSGCSRVVVNEGESLLIGIIGQYRYWTLSRARLCALDVLRNHLEAFPIRKS
jgi:hypothetical protein